MSPIDTRPRDPMVTLPPFTYRNSIQCNLKYLKINRLGVKHTKLFYTDPTEKFCKYLKYFQNNQ